jgi:predicted nucleotidyltransferase
LGSSDFKEFFALLHAKKVEFLVIGGVAYNHYAPPRATKDIDVWIRPSVDNCANFIAAVAEFGFPTGDLTAFDLAGDDRVLILGRAPNRIDVLTHPGGCDWETAWSRRTMSDYDEVPLPVIGLEDLILMKAHAGRPQDLVDVVKLRKVLQAG